MINLLVIKSFAMFWNKTKFICLPIIIFLNQVKKSSNIGDNRNIFLKLESKLRLHHVVPKTPKTSPEKPKLIVVEMQLLLDIEMTNSKEEKSCLKWTIYNDRRKVCVNLQTDTDKLNIVVYRWPKQVIPQRWGSWSKNDKIPVTSGKTNLSFELNWHILQAVHCAEWNNCSWLTQTPSGMDIFFPHEHFLIVPGIKHVIWTQ